MICDRCKRRFKGAELVGFFEGCYFVKSGFWKIFRRGRERIVCERCIHKSREFKKFYLQNGDESTDLLDENGNSDHHNFTGRRRNPGTNHTTERDRAEILFTRVLERKARRCILGT